MTSFWKCSDSRFLKTLRGEVCVILRWRKKADAFLQNGALPSWWYDISSVLTLKVRGNSDRPIKKLLKNCPKSRVLYYIAMYIFQLWWLNDWIFKPEKRLEFEAKSKSNFDPCLPFVYGGLHEFASNIASVARSDIKLSVAMQFIKIQVTLAQEVKVTLLMNYLRYTIKCYEWIQNLRLENVMIPDLYLKKRQ